jgi:hypothetical protein
VTAWSLLRRSMALTKCGPCRLPVPRGGPIVRTAARAVSRHSSGSGAGPSHSSAVLGRLEWLGCGPGTLVSGLGAAGVAWVRAWHTRQRSWGGWSGLGAGLAHSSAVLGRLEWLRCGLAHSSAVLGRLEWLRCGPGTLVSRLGTANGAEGASDQDVTRRPPRRAPCLTRHQTSDHACSVQRVGPGPAWNATSRSRWVIAAWVLA